MQDYDVHFIDKDGSYNKKILAAERISDIIEYMVALGHAEKNIEKIQKRS